ncbi:NAD-dependent epimerase/dehydratase family protein [Paenibacillus puerhi]|uniref:NAD-dependent epimerase/dehydratase family protein n=1 Tax=Paenibacillus puerhi TaxID=2692622 RepID=UPI00135CBB70|nr:NAD-dependent epimerase/dehydratase family protein [Paenibacillus puerhi]
MRILVTGAAGFIGSHLCERLLQDPHHEVIGLDALVPSASPVSVREQNLAGLLGHPRFQFLKQDLLEIDWSAILPQVDAVYHLAGIPGVRSSWGTDFQTYVSHNILATQRLLEGCRRFPVSKFIYASTSSVYGEQAGAVREDAVTRPLSPYGVSKLTGEHLCKVYTHNDGLPVVILRFFTVYGPRQRTDMAFHRFIRQLLHQEPITIYGDGTQSRDFTFVRDCVHAIASVLDAPDVIGETINIGGKERATVLESLALLEELLEVQGNVQFIGKIYGEPKQTWADIRKAQRLLSYEPQTTLREGLALECANLRQLYNL